VRILVPVFLIIFGVSQATAQTCESIATQFFKGIQEEKIQETMDRAFATNPYSAGMRDSLTQTTTQLASTLVTI
jgi:hypothetical protein